ncbi:MAG: DUF2207 domain-containing protein [Spirochaetes bacterium]|jgi:uncharacterized membrane protein YgcG|nr:DUF2207 domain-containing protein [Spirochaetota bacterium]
MNGKKLIILLLAVAVTLGGTSVRGQGDERILRFDSTIIVREDGSLRVTEIITVRSASDRIKRGIYRDFPTIYRGKFGFNKSVPFDVVEVQRDGHPEPFHVESIDRGKRVYIGSENVYLDPDIYTYSLTYTTDFQLGFSHDFTELYWNVTGNQWEFTIDSATAELILPRGARGHVISHEAYTGVEGEKGRSYSSSINASGAVHFSSSKMFAPGEGLTIAVRWPADLIDPPDHLRQRERFLHDNMGAVTGIGGFFLVLLYYMVAWVLAGRDPRKGVIIPLYAAPDGLSPAALRFVSQMGYDNRAFAAAIVGMAVRGHCTISDDDGVYTLRKLDGEGSDLTPEEKKILEKLFGKDKSIALETANHSRISGAIKAARRTLSLNYEKQYFLRNVAYFVPGLLLSVTVIAISIVFGFLESPETFLLIWLAFWSIGVVLLLWKVTAAWREAVRMRGGIRKVFASGGAVFLTLFALPFVGAEIVVLVIYLQSGSPWILLTTICLALVNFLFYHLLKAPTRTGRALMDKIEGFRLFLNVAERDRLNAVMPPEKTPATFERFLPYAIALGVENRWAEYFSGMLAESAAAGAYSPSWYSGASLAHIGTGEFASSLGNSFSSAISSSATAPGSSSGGGGGGSSGGGGGGGGGGGW